MSGTGDPAAPPAVAALDRLLVELEALPDTAARQLALDVVGALLELYGDGLGRIVAALARPGGDAVRAALLADDLVAHLLLLHDLHPADLASRVGRALDEVRPYLQSHGGDVELLGVEAGTARLRLVGTCSGCPSSTATLRSTIHEAIHRVAPDLERIETAEAGG